MIRTNFTANMLRSIETEIKHHIDKEDVISMVGGYTAADYTPQVIVDIYPQFNSVGLVGRSAYTEFEIQMYRSHIYISLVHVSQSLAGNKIGSRMMAECLRTAASLGFNWAELEAAHGQNPYDQELSWNGAYTWARCGFKPGYDVSIKGKQYDLHELMLTKAGRELWRKSAYENHMAFDLGRGSSCWQVLDSYLSE